MLEATRPNGTGPDALDRIYVPSNTGAQVPLSSSSRSPAPGRAVDRPPGPVPGDDDLVQPRARRRARRRGQGGRGGDREGSACRASIHGEFAGTAQAFQDAQDDEQCLVPLAIFFVYIVLGILYESYIHPITILSTLPSAGLGALIALLVTGTDLS